MRDTGTDVARWGGAWAEHSGLFREPDMPGQCSCLSLLHQQQGCMALRSDSSVILLCAKSHTDPDSVDIYSQMLRALGRLEAHKFCYMCRV